MQPEPMTFHEGPLILIVWSMHSDTTHQPAVASPSVVSQTTSIYQQVMDQFAQMKTMLTSFLSLRQETTRIAFCNYLASEVEYLKERDFQTFRNKAVNLSSGIQSRAEARTHQPSNLHFLGAPVQLPHMLSAATAISSHCQGIHLDYSSNTDACKPFHPTSSAKPSDAQRTEIAQRTTDFVPSC